MHDGPSAGRFSPSGYLGWVAAYQGDVGLDPLEGGTLIIKTGVGQTIGLHCYASKPAICTELISCQRREGQVGKGRVTLPGSYSRQRLYYRPTPVAHRSHYRMAVCLQTGLCLQRNSHLHRTKIRRVASMKDPLLLRLGRRYPETNNLRFHQHLCIYSKTSSKRTFTSISKRWNRNPTQELIRSLANRTAGARSRQRQCFDGRLDTDGAV